MKLYVIRNSPKLCFKPRDYAESLIYRKNYKLTAKFSFNAIAA